MRLHWGLEEDVHRGLESLEEHELPALPSRSQADSLNVTEERKLLQLMRDLPEGQDGSSQEIRATHSMERDPPPPMYPRVPCPTHKPHSVSSSYFKNSIFFCLCMCFLEYPVLGMTG